VKKSAQPAKKSELTPKQQAFVLEYLKDLNSSRAAISAGYSTKNSNVTGPRLLANVRIASEIQKAMDARAKRCEITADRVLREIALLGFSNMGDYIQIQKDGSFFVDFSKLTREQQAVIQEATVEEYMEGKGENARQVRRMKFKLADKGQNLERLGKHLKLFVEKHEHSIVPSVNIDFRQATDEELRRLIARGEASPAMWD